MKANQNPNRANHAPLASHGADPLSGRFATPGDIGLSHRALVLAALTVGHSSIAGLSEAAEVQATIEALRQLGVGIEQRDAVWHVHGLGVGGLLEPEGILDLGATGSGATLLLGALAPHRFTARLRGVGTAERATLEALAAIGATATEVDGLVTLRGPALPLPLTHRLAQASEAVKSALLLAGAQIAGISTVVEPTASPDHLERLLLEFGAAVSMTPDEGGVSVSITGLTDLRPQEVTLAGDPVLAGYPVVAALVVPGSDLIVENVLVNPGRTGLIDTLLEMGGDIQFLNQREAGGEPVSDLRIRSSRLKGIRVDAEHAATMLEDIPALAMAAACANGETVIEGLGALRVGPSDRLAAIAAGLASSKVTVAEGDEDITIGGIGKVEGGGMVASRGDAAVAMSFLVLGLASQKRVTVDDSSGMAMRFPGFVAAMTPAGARFDTVKGNQ